MTLGDATMFGAIISGMIGIVMALVKVLERSLNGRAGRADPCHSCRSTVADTHGEMVEHRRESHEAQREQTGLLREIRDGVRDMARVPRAASGPGSRL